MGTTWYHPFVTLGFLAAATETGAAAQPRDRPAVPPPARGGQGVRHARRPVRRAGDRRRGCRSRRARVRAARRRLRRPGRLGRAVAAGHPGGARRRVPGAARRRLGPRRLGRPGPAPGAGVRADLGRRVDAGRGPPGRPVRRRLAAPGGEAQRPAGRGRADPPAAGRGRPPRGVRRRGARRLLRRDAAWDVGRFTYTGGPTRSPTSCGRGSRPAPTRSRCGSARATGPRWSTRSSASAPRSPRCCRADPAHLGFRRGSGRQGDQNREENSEGQTTRMPDRSSFASG